MPYFSLYMKKFIKEIYPYVIIIVVALLIKKFLFSPIRVVGPSMNNTLLNGDIMILDKISYRFNKIKRSDIVVIKTNKNLIIKRVIAIPGDALEYGNNTLVLNGKEKDEPYLSKGVTTEDFNLKELTGYEKVPEGYYFVMGDNRGESADSRMIGLIPIENIEGHARYTIFPLNRFGSK